MKVLTLLGLLSSLVLAEAQIYKGNAPQTRPILENDQHKRHVPDSEAFQKESGGKEAQEEVKKNHLDVRPEDQKKKQKGE